MPETQDVTPDPSTGTVDPAIEPSAVAPAPVERPIDNAVAEFNRKFAKLERQFESLTQYLTTAQPPKTAEVKPPDGVSDDDLWRLAQQGDHNAYVLYMQRIADRQFDTRYSGVRRDNTVDAQLMALGQKYPVLNDSNHPLTQTVHMAYQLFLQQGYTAGKATMLDAIKTSIADRPDLISEFYAQGQQAREAGRQSATRVAQAGQTGATHREAPAPISTKVKPSSPQEIALAKRMNIKDPVKSKERFLERQASGQSALGAVAGFIKEEEF